MQMMFLCTISKPSDNAHIKSMSDGKIGILAFVTNQVVIRNSRN